jgi:multiple sugar transport system ATP-binding protein
MSRVELIGISKSFDDVTALDGVSIDVENGSFFVLLGPSGAGKTTTLRVIAGLETPDAGSVRFDGADAHGATPAARDVAMVFQSYALYPKQTVAQNIASPLRARNTPADEAQVTVEEVATLLHIEHLLQRHPRQLSGGEQQRVALGRALVREPRAFLMDEPLSNLDAKLRVQTRAELIELQRRLEATVVYVTHDQVEAMTMGHRIAVMEHGRLLQVDEPQQVYAKPHNLFVARFIGNPPMNTLEGTVARDGDTTVLRLDGSTVALPPDVGGPLSQRNVERVVIGIRPEHLQFDTTGLLDAKVTVVESLGHERHVICRLDDGQMLIARQPSSATPPAEGEAVHLAAPSEHVHVFDAETGARIDA